MGLVLAGQPIAGAILTVGIRLLVGSGKAGLGPKPEMVASARAGGMLSVQAVKVTQVLANRLNKMG